METTMTPTTTNRTTNTNLNTNTIDDEQERLETARRPRMLFLFFLFSTNNYLQVGYKNDDTTTNCCYIPTTIKIKSLGPKGLFFSRHFSLY
jgi:hypothetical protein